MKRRMNDGDLAGERVDVDEIANDVLEEKSSYIVGLGYGPKPKQRCIKLYNQDASRNFK